MQGMDLRRIKAAAEWYRNTVYRDEPISSRPGCSSEPLPPMLRTARALEKGVTAYRQSRESLFVKQGKVLAGYEDDYPYDRPVLRYFPTYQSLSDEELRAYFTWRTKLRRGEIQRTSLTFVYLYIYELLNQIGVSDPDDGYQKLLTLRDAYRSIDPSILPYLIRWMWDYVVYYRLDPALLQDTPSVRFDRQLFMLIHRKERSEAEVMDAVRGLSTYRLDNSRFYKGHSSEMDTVILRILDRVDEHYQKRCKKTMIEDYFGRYTSQPVMLFASAVFYDRRKAVNVDYSVDELCTYHCRNGLWTVERYDWQQYQPAKLNALLKTIDSVMRETFGYRYPVRPALSTQWLLKLIRAEAEGLLAEQKAETERLLAKQKAEEAKKVRIDFSSLDRIRRDAAYTQDRLIVEEELEDDVPISEAPPPEPEPDEAANVALPLNEDELHLLRCLLYGGDLNWVQASGRMLSVLVDGINDNLFDLFGDTVLELNSSPQLIEDYIDELKEMIHP